MAVLVTGGTGYIGSHTVIELLENDQDVIIIDNLCNSSIEVLDKIKEITNKKIKFYEVDLLDINSINNVFKKHEITSVIHFAALKSVGESAKNPLEYYMVNVTGTLNLCKVMEVYNVNQFIFSSSATVYGIPEKLPLTENAKLEAINPYGRTKLMCEEILKDIANSNKHWKIALLRYFNPVGAHESGLIGENPNGIPNNLMPYVTKVALGELEHLNIYGDDYPTKDGTGVRDYIHVSDLAKGHVSALKNIHKFTKNYEIFNLGAGKGYSVLEVVKEFERVSGVKVPYEIKDRRLGDAAASYSDPSKANNELEWKTEKNLNEICLDIWNWVQKGYVKGELTR